MEFGPADTPASPVLESGDILYEEVLAQQQVIQDRIRARGDVWEDSPAGAVAQMPALSGEGAENRASHLPEDCGSTPQPTSSRCETTVKTRHSCPRMPSTSPAASQPSRISPSTSSSQLPSPSATTASSSGTVLLSSTNLLIPLHHSPDEQADEEKAKPFNYTIVRSCNHRCGYIDCCHPARKFNCSFCNGSHEDDDCAYETEIEMRKKIYILKAICPTCQEKRSKEHKCKVGIKCAFCHSNRRTSVCCDCEGHKMFLKNIAEKVDNKSPYCLPSEKAYTARTAFFAKLVTVNGLHSKHSKVNSNAKPQTDPRLKPSKEGSKRIADAGEDELPLKKKSQHRQEEKSVEEEATKSGEINSAMEAAAKIELQLSAQLKNNASCFFCSGPHESDLCQAVWNPQARKKECNNRRKCYKCFEDYHYGHICKHMESCRYCSKAHFTACCSHSAHLNFLAAFKARLEQKARPFSNSLAPAVLPLLLRTDKPASYFRQDQEYHKCAYQYCCDPLGVSGLCSFCNGRHKDEDCANIGSAQERSDYYRQNFICRRCLKIPDGYDFKNHICPKLLDYNCWRCGHREHTATTCRNSLEYTKRLQEEKQRYLYQSTDQPATLPSLRALES